MTTAFSLSVKGIVFKKPQLDKSEIELEPDALQRFERAINVVAKSPPQHRTKKIHRQENQQGQKSKNSTLNWQQRNLVGLFYQLFYSRVLA
ncbi:MULTISPECIES: hypothetical protein [unclassified Bradyrhizobium]|uniref:hypothetical protein n=1 Tax=unclassified Bradyrhizobium TaxID=2631580 RepID=UPI001FF91F2C|nr:MULTISPECIES: hypothetical protein [unclassified Bradyrhizobium]MCK1713814.1 hypothetical protein [Bradyrhizobium sp. 143]MCK1728014.1 hypothetical protein [Bradyrhizobium sp. 142]